MARIKINEIFAYIFVSVLAVGLAFGLSLRVLKDARSQTSESAQQPTAPVSAVPEAVDLTRPAFPQETSTTSDARNIEVFLEPFIYDERDRRDPFLQFSQSESGEEVNLGPLQHYPLSSLTLIGIMWDVKNPKAMFIDPSKRVHVASLDEGIGNKNGYIATIREGEVVVVEAERSDAGLEYFTRVIPLAR